MSPLSYTRSPLFKLGAFDNSNYQAQSKPQNNCNKVGQLQLDIIVIIFIIPDIPSILIAFIGLWDTPRPLAAPGQVTNQ